MVAAKITSKGQITIPKEVRDRLGLKPGDSLEFAFDGDRLDVRPRKRRSIMELRGAFPAAQAPSGRHPRSWKEERELAWRAMTERLAPGWPGDDE